jgi:hypothetical protein
MLVRLAAWDMSAQERAKSPMPPVAALQTLGTTAQEWRRSEELKLLRAHLEELSRQEGHSSDVAELVKDGYEALPQCLPTAD